MVIPPEAKLSNQAKDLILKLMTDSKDRLGVNGVQEIKKHPFFQGIDWNYMRNTKAPLLPDVRSEQDTRNFDKFEESEPWITEYKLCK